MNEEPIKLEENWRNPDGRLKPGHPDIGGGRPKGKTLKECVRDKLLSMTEEEREEFLKDIPKETRWRMAEGNPHQTSDITSGDKPIPLLNVLLHHDSNKEDSEAPEKN